MLVLSAALGDLAGFGAEASDGFAGSVGLGASAGLPGSAGFGALAEAGVPVGAVLGVAGVESGLSRSSSVGMASPEASGAAALGLELLAVTGMSASPHSNREPRAWEPPGAAEIAGFGAAAEDSGLAAGVAFAWGAGAAATGRGRGCRCWS